MTLLEKLQFLALIIFHYLIWKIERIAFYLNIRRRSKFKINGSFDSPEKVFSINFTKTNTKFCFILHYGTVIVTSF